MVEAVQSLDHWVEVLYDSVRIILHKKHFLLIFSPFFVNCLVDCFCLFQYCVHILAEFDIMSLHIGLWIFDCFDIQLSYVFFLLFGAVDLHFWIAFSNRIQYSVRYVILELVLSQLHDKYKVWAFTFLWSTYYAAIEHFDNFFGDVETQTYSFAIDLFGRVKETKEFEQFRHVLLSYTKSSIVHGHFKKLTFVPAFHSVNEFSILHA